ncbi:MAG: hypothetical protein H6742_08075 [Alphaproteobacteria bacterium]|nr:hypothetical protein [Alphaproteobacteria bacterium]
MTTWTMLALLTSAPSLAAGAPAAGAPAANAPVATGDAGAEELDLSPAPVVEAVPGGHIDWTRLVLVVESESDRKVGAWMDRQIQEQDAIDRLRPAFADLARRVRVTPDTLAADLVLGEGDLSRRLAEGVQDWQVTETRYHDSGVVQLTAELDLRRWLRPALRSLSAQGPAPEGPGEATGILVDARALPFEPCVAPRITAPTGTVLIGAQRLVPAAYDEGPPVLFVSDPADLQAIERIGDRPVLVVATSVQHGGELVLDPASARTVESLPDLAALAALGRVVIVTGGAP